MENKDEDASMEKLVVESLQPAAEELRTICFYGDVNEKLCGDVVSALSYFNDNAKTYRLSDPDDLESDIVEETKPVKMIVSTMGGSAPEMFAVYDMMRHLRETCDLETLGLGKVMSAGVLLLAAGTKGKRKIGQNCRVMLHSVMGGYQGTLTHMENEIAEVRWMQDRYIKCLEAETNMCEREIKRMFKKHMDVYLSAEEAVEFGIADEIV